MTKYTFTIKLTSSDAESVLHMETEFSPKPEKLDKAKPAPASFLAGCWAVGMLAAKLKSSEDVASLAEDLGIGFQQKTATEPSPKIIY